MVEVNNLNLLRGSMTNFVYIFGVILFTVYGQLVVKWQVARAGAFPNSFSEKVIFLTHLVLNPWVFSGIGAGFLALLCWLAALTKFELSYAYPFMSLAFVLVLILPLSEHRGKFDLTGSDLQPKSAPESTQWPYYSNIR